jgi:hypothetical protein
MPDIDNRVPAQSECARCGFVVSEVDGILRALTSKTKARFEQFIRDYEVVRAKEGWGSQTASYYFALPFKDLTNKHTWIWRIRARTMLYMQKHLLPKLDGPRFDCRVLDIGAGNGWLSYRLSKAGYLPVAVDLLVLEERRAVFEQQFGVRSDNIHSREYLTPKILDQLSDRLGIKWNVSKPWYGLRWAMRPLRALILRRREPSKFYLFWFKWDERK